MNPAELFIGQIPEAIYFALFMIYVKQIKAKRITFILISIIEYVLVMQMTFFSIWSHVAYIVLMYITLKLLYKERAQIVDVFTFVIASMILILFSGITFLLIGPNMIWVSIISRILMIAFIVIFKNKLFNIQKLYKKLWNRNDKSDNKIKSTTFRSLNVVILNMMFYVINLGMLYALIFKK